jgi:hypothetical protein
MESSALAATQPLQALVLTTAQLPTTAPKMF